MVLSTVFMQYSVRKTSKLCLATPFRYNNTNQYFHISRSLIVAYGKHLAVADLKQATVKHMEELDIQDGRQALC